MSATPPAIPARTAPAATSGVFAFEATFETFSPAAATGPFCEEERALPADVDVVVRREVLALPLFDPVRFVLEEALDLDAVDLDVPFLLVDLLPLDPLRLERVLEELVVWAIVIASLGFRASCAYSRRRFTPITRSVRI